MERVTGQPAGREKQQTALAGWRRMLPSVSPSRGGPHVGASARRRVAGLTTILWPFILQNQVVRLVGHLHAGGPLPVPPGVLCRPKAGLSPRAEPQPVAFRGSCTPGHTFARGPLPSSKTKPGCSDGNGPGRRPRPAVLEGGSGRAVAGDSFPEGIVFESGSSEAR